MFEQAVSYVQARPRRSLLIASSLLIFVLSLSWLSHYRNNGLIIVKTNDSGSSIELSSIGASEVSKEARGELRARVASGQYVVAVSGRFSSSKRIVQVSPHKTAVYTINLQKPIDPEYVLPIGAANIMAGPSTLYYLNADDHFLYRLGSDGLPAVVDENVTFSTIKWQSEHYGVGLDQDGKALYAIRDGAVSPIGLPFQSSEQLHYDLSPSGRLVISNDKDVYSQQSGEAFNKLYGTNNTIESLGTSDTATLVLQKAGGGETSAVVIDARGRLLTGKDDFSVYSYAWSPDGKRLAATGDTVTTIYDTRLNEVVSLSDKNVLALTWLNNNTLLYSVNGSLFGYRLKEAVSSRLAVTPVNRIVTGAYPSVNGSEIYLLLAKSNNPRSFVTMRIHLGAGQNVPSYSHTLGIFFPSHTDQCSFSYTNFLRPLVIINAWTNTDTCSDAAREELKADGLPLGSIGIVFQAQIDE